jgi:hypothetical protein
LAPWFDMTERDWQLRLVLARGDTPDIVIHRRRAAGMPPAEVFLRDSPGIRDIVPALPYEWISKGGKGKEGFEGEWQVPRELRGKLVRIEMEGSSDKAEPFTIKLEFRSGGHRAKPLMLKPQFFPEGGKTFDSIPIPADADTCKISVPVEKGTKHISITGFRVIADGP